VAQAVVRESWADLFGIGRVVLSYPELFSDGLHKGALTTKSICRTFSDCTTAAEWDDQRLLSARQVLQRQTGVSKAQGSQTPTRGVSCIKEPAE
jgi:hypothetical protein